MVNIWNIRRICIAIDEVLQKYILNNNIEKNVFKIKKLFLFKEEEYKGKTEIL